MEKERSETEGVNNETVNVKVTDLYGSNYLSTGAIYLTIECFNVP